MPSLLGSAGEDGRGYTIGAIRGVQRIQPPAATGEQIRRTQRTTDALRGDGLPQRATLCRPITEKIRAQHHA